MVEPRLTNSRQPKELLASIWRHLLAEQYEAKLGSYYDAVVAARYEARMLWASVESAPRPIHRKARRIQHG